MTRQLRPLLLALSVAAHGSASGQIQFQDVRASGDVWLGVPVEGIAVLDLDGDEFLDLLVAGEDGQYALFQNIPDAARPGNRNFADVTAGSGLSDTDGPRATEVQSMVTADYDRDGDVDVYCEAMSDNSSRMGILFRNEGSGQFTNVTIAAGVEITGVNVESTAAWGDFNLDGWVDLLIVAESSDYRLFQNEGDGTFCDVSDRIAAPFVPSYTYVVLWTDKDLDGWLDIVTAWQDGTLVVLRNVEALDGGREFVTSQQMDAHSFSPMAISAADYDADGDLDIAISVDGEGIGILYDNMAGTYAPVLPFILDCTWGVSWIDADNDGDQDMFSASCHEDPDDMVENLGGGLFQEISDSLGSPLTYSLHSVRLDYNNDGREDVFVNDPGQFVTVYENVTSTTNHWLNARLMGDGDVNPDAIGAIVRLSSGGEVQMREVTSGSSTTASEDPRLHFGLGSRTTVDWIEVVWPRAGTIGARTELFPGPFSIDSFVTLTPGVSVPCPADTDGSGDVSVTDLVSVIVDWGCIDPPGPCVGDVNGDGTVSVQDLVDVVTSWGPCP